jgi:hypothetical protein
MKHVLPALALAASVLAGAPAAYAQVTTYRATMSGPAEATPNPSPGYGVATIVIDLSANTLQLTIPFADLVGTTTAGHLHCCTAAPLTGAAPPATMVPSFPGFPTGVSSGNYSVLLNLLDPATYNPSFITGNGGTVAGAASALAAGLAGNQSYLNIHTTAYPGGEIRGFLVAVPIPEPANWAMMAAGLAVVGFRLRRRKQA